MWTIPAQREPIPDVRYSERGAKMKTPHLVPLSKQVVTVLKQLKLLSGNGELLFPGDHDPRKPMSENTINKALRGMGWSRVRQALSLPQSGIFNATSLLSIRVSAKFSQWLARTVKSVTALKGTASNGCV